MRPRPHRHAELRCFQPRLRLPREAAPPAAGRSLSGTTFQRELVEQFMQAVGMFPAGSLVKLNTGEVALVIEHNRVRRLRSKLMLLLNPDKTPVSRHALMDLKAKPAGVDEDEARWILRSLEPGAFGLDPKDYFG